MNVGKRQGKSIDIPGNKKPRNAADIPSSNFLADKGKKLSKVSVTSSNSISSVPTVPLKMRDTSRIIHNLPLPDKYKEVLGPNVYELKKYAEKKEKKLKEIEKFQKMQPQPTKQEPLENLKQEQMPKNLFSDETGRVRDEHGNIVNLKPQNVSSLKININRVKDDRIKEMLKYQKSNAVSGFKESKLFDSGLVVTSAAKRNKRLVHALHFIEKGSIQTKAEAYRKKLEMKKAIIQQRMKKKLEENVGLSTDKNENKIISEEEIKQDNQTKTEVEEQKLDTDVINMGLRRVTVRIKHHDPIPDVEWWDIPLMKDQQKGYLATSGEEESVAQDGKQAEWNEQKIRETLEQLSTYEFSEETYNRRKITLLIEHPEPFKLANTQQSAVIPMYLTKQERKKLRRQKRAEREKEKQDNIRLGLAKAPPPKVKLSNFMRVMGTDAIIEPSKAEAETKKQVAERLQQHLDRNEQKKLNKEQRADRSLRKLKRDSAKECRIALFRVEDLTDKKIKFKIDMNARQLALNGFCLICDRASGLNFPNLVVVEGGPRAIKFYKKLMLKRIKWEQPDHFGKNLENSKSNSTEIDDINTHEQSNNHHLMENNLAQNNHILKNIHNKCALVWEGIAKDHLFNRWRVMEIFSEMAAKKALAERNAETYWDMVINYKYPET